MQSTRVPVDLGLPVFVMRIVSLVMRREVSTGINFFGGAYCKAWWCTAVLCVTET
jgi:hypothetical protein